MTYHIGPEVRELILKGVRRLNIVEDRVNHICGSSILLSKLIRIAYEEDVLTEDDLMLALRERVRYLGKVCYNQTQGIGFTKEDPEHCISPQALAYAIEQKVVSMGELSQMTFPDFNDSHVAFCRRFGGDVPERVYQSLVARSEPEEAGPVTA